MTYSFLYLPRGKSYAKLVAVANVLPIELSHTLGRKQQGLLWLEVERVVYGVARGGVEEIGLMLSGQRSGCLRRFATEINAIRDKDKAAWLHTGNSLCGAIT